MKLKFFVLILLILGFASAGDIVFIPQDTLYFDYLGTTPTIDGSYNSIYESCTYVKTFSDLIVRTCYYGQSIYIYFQIADSTSTSGDYFYLGIHYQKTINTYKTIL